MTNKDFMCMLDTALFEKAMRILYFSPGLWIDGDDVKKESTPTMFDIRKWLDKPFDPYTRFWKIFIDDELDRWRQKVELETMAKKEV